MPRVWNTPVFILATVYFVADGMFSHVTQPITAWFARKRLFERVRLWVISLGPYPSLALFAVPVIILEPAKPLAAYLLGTGHFFAGAVTFITAEVLKLTLVERLFQLNREKLLSIPAFASGYQYWRHMMDVVDRRKFGRLHEDWRPMPHGCSGPDGFNISRSIDPLGLTIIRSRTRVATETGGRSQYSGYKSLFYFGADASQCDQGSAFPGILNIKTPLLLASSPCTTVLGYRESLASVFEADASGGGLAQPTLELVREIEARGLP
jgi:hypothetical protein